ncbi:hypothetical protein AbraIFM66951_000268 [Aspergillus brasiliensis]|uniref:Nucleoside phosphorylase domain-containing protein n=1 Tax=Aspergillus brasiliensis TaxID=319629 RepID=A0A9W6DGM6_9EURO|nr:hypothetical protein AbraCBS73388_000079 [Aspergillus brasiliensis]GKZ40499.1 hypothetical protein AbraIFM66951_000268 [Aspergillus brasiliensis]
MSPTTSTKKNPPPLHTYKIAYITALPKEQTAVLATFDSIHQQHHHQIPTPLTDKNTYTLGCIAQHNIVLLCLPTMGTTAAASAVTSLLHTFPSIKFVLLVGIGAVFRETGYGWVMWWLVYLLMVAMQHAGGGLNRPGGKLLGAVNRLRSEYALFGVGVGRVLRELEEAPRGGLGLGREFTRCEELRDPMILGDKDGGGCWWSVLGSMVWGIVVTILVGVFGFRLDGMKVRVEEGRNKREGDVCEEEQKSEKQVNVHYGLIASGNWAVRDAKARDALNKRFEGQLLCIETGGAAGVMNEVPSLVICGISDYADASANDDWQAYAATVAAAYAKELLGFLHPCVDDVDMEHLSRAGIETEGRYLSYIC